MTPSITVTIAHVPASPPRLLFPVSTPISPRESSTLTRQTKSIPPPTPVYALTALVIRASAANSAATGCEKEAACASSHSIKPL